MNFLDKYLKKRGYEYAILSHVLILRVQPFFWLLSVGLTLSSQTFVAVISLFQLKEVLCKRTNAPLLIWKAALMRSYKM